MMKKLLQYPRVPLLWIIRIYQRTLSPDHGPARILFRYGFCKYNPSCSEYGYRAIQKYGLIRGVPMTAWRVLKCNPFSKGGDDPVK